MGVQRSSVARRGKAKKYPGGNERMAASLITVVLLGKQSTSLCLKQRWQQRARLGVDTGPAGDDSGADCTDRRVEPHYKQVVVGYLSQSLLDGIADDSHAVALGGVVPVAEGAVAHRFDRQLERQLVMTWIAGTGRRPQRVEASR